MVVQETHLWYTGRYDAQHITCWCMCHVGVQPHLLFIIGEHELRRITMLRNHVVYERRFRAFCTDMRFTDFPVESCHSDDAGGRTALTIPQFRESTGRALRGTGLRIA